MRALALIVLGIGLIILAFALIFPGEFRLMDNRDLAQIVWLLAAAALVGSGAFGVARGRPVGLGRALAYLVAWVALFAVALLLYQAWQAYTASPNVTT